MKIFFRAAVIFLISAVFLAGCGQSEKNIERKENRRVRSKSKGITKNQIIKERKLIKEGSIAFKCSDIEKTKNAVIQIVKQRKGYIARENQNSYGNRVEVRYVIRTPSEGFDLLVGEIADIAEKLDSKSVNVKDVTEEYMDIKTRIRIKKEVEAKYRKLLKRAGSINEILAIEKNIGKIRAEIERAEGRIKYLNNRISLSTLNVRFYKFTSTPGGFFSDISDGFSDGWDSFLVFLVGLVKIWPFLIIISAVTFLIIKYRRGKKKSKNQQ